MSANKCSLAHLPSFAVYCHYRLTANGGNHCANTATPKQSTVSLSQAPADDHMLWARALANYSGIHDASSRSAPSEVAPARSLSVSARWNACRSGSSSCTSARHTLRINANHQAHSLTGAAPRPGVSGMCHAPSDCELRWSLIGAHLSSWGPASSYNSPRQDAFTLMCALCRKRAQDPGFTCSRMSSDNWLGFKGRFCCQPLPAPAAAFEGHVVDLSARRVQVRL